MAARAIAWATRHGGPGQRPHTGGRAVKAALDQEMRAHLRENAMVAQPDRGRADYLRGYGFAPDLVVDIGVDTGTPQLYRAFPKAKFVLIDARAEAEAQMQARGAPADYAFHACGVGAAPGEMELRIPVTAKGAATARAGFRTASGPMARNIEGYETRPVPVRTVDEIMRAYPGRVGMKIDTEGFEYEVLRGAGDTLARCDFVMLELSVTPRFEGVAPPSRVFAELARAGLEFRDILRSTGDGKGGPRPRLFDALFAPWGET